MVDIYNFTLKDFKGQAFNLSDYKGKVIIVVNVASKCGLSNSSYGRMKTILDEHKEVVFILCPCKQFMNQEYDHPDEIARYVSEKLAIEKKNIESSASLEVEHVKDIKRVILTEPVEVRGGTIHPLFDFLTRQKGGWLTNSIKWNFSSFL